MINIDNVYGVHVNNDEPMLGDKQINLDKNDDIIIDGKRYAGTPDLYEFTFKKISDENTYRNADIQIYKNILLATNAYKHDHNVYNSIKGNKRYKYKNIIALLLLGKKVGRNIPSAMILNNKRLHSLGRSQRACRLSSIARSLTSNGSQ